jgi:ABC-type uncharacterized transport system permease subunit
MILSADPAALLAWLVIAGYLAAAVATHSASRWPLWSLLGAWCLHALVLVAGAAGWGDGEVAQGMRFGFAPVVSFTVWLVLLVHGVESRLVPVGGLRRVLALLGAVAVLLGVLFPGEVHVVPHSRWAPMHWLLGLTSYGLLATAVLHALLLDAAEQRLRQGGQGAAGAFGMPLLKLERLTFRFVQAGFVVLTLTLALGVGAGAWRWDHKTVLSLLGWATFAHLIMGRAWRGWRGRRATRWVYAGALLLLLAYVGSRFVMEVVLHRTAL